MEWADDGDVLVARLDNDEDFFDSLEKVCREAKCFSGSVLTGIGMLKEFEIGFFDGKNYKIYSRMEPAELVALNGTIAFEKTGDNLEFKPHFHAVLAKEDHIAIGGHLRKAKVNLMNEIVIRKNKKAEFRRLRNPENNLTYLKFHI